ncbi:MAG: phosphate/phosphite/phosphonate ABC transporter substrate-binding protein [Bryobacteraceae bacterium]
MAQQGGLDPAANPGTGGLRRARLYAIASSRMFTTVNRNDAVAAIKVGFELTGKERGFLLDARVDIVDGVAEMKQRLESRSVDILILDFIDYLQLEGARLIVPDLVGNRNDGAGPRYSYLLLVGASSTAGTIADLRGKNLNYFSRSESNTGLAWIEVTLGKLKLGRASSFFATAKNTTKPQACVLPLFFGTVDACVVDEINLELLKEMNPQLGKLRVLARSTPVIDSVIATPVPPQPYREELLDAIRALHQSPRGRQVLMVFKTGRVVRISPGDIEAARALWVEYRRVAGSLPPSTPSLAPFSGAGTPVTEIHENRAQKKD